MDVIKAFHVHIMFHYDKIDISSCRFSLHALAREGGCEKENPNPCHALPLKIQTWGVVEIGVSCKARKGTRSFSIVMKCSRIEEGTFEKMYKGRQKACGLTMALKEM
jgi:hypothetical protein